MAHTTLSIDKDIYEKTAARAKGQHLSVSAIARMLLDAYSNGRINIVAIQADEPIELIELSGKDITPEIRKRFNEAYDSDESEWINIPA